MCWVPTGEDPGEHLGIELLIRYSFLGIKEASANSTATVSYFFFCSYLVVDIWQTSE